MAGGDPKSVVVVPVDLINEQVVLAAAAAGAMSALAVQLPSPDAFLHETHRRLWAGMLELRRRGLEYDGATLYQVAPDCDVVYMAQLREQRPTMPANLDHHVAAMQWDATRATAAGGAVNAFLGALTTPGEEPARVCALARQIVSAVEGGYRAEVRDTRALVDEQAREMDALIRGEGAYPFGVEGLDYYEDKGGGARLRLVPGAKPGLTTVVTSISGGGKSTLARNIAIGLMLQKRPVAFGAWEMTGGITLRQLACMRLGIDQATTAEPGLLDAATRDRIRDVMAKMAPWCHFLDNPYARMRGKRSDNDRNLDLLQAMIADTGAEVFIGDLFERCLASSETEDEKRALFRAQEMSEELKIHSILLAQQRLKDVEQRDDPRPTRDGIKGSAAWTEVPDTVLAPYIPSLFKDVADDRMEVLVLKQRYGKWPLAVEFDYDARTGVIARGRSVPYAHRSPGGRRGGATNGLMGGGFS